MNSSTSNKGAVLDQLRSSRHQFANRPNPSAPSSSVIPQPNQPRYPVPPPQSRDATLPSRFFPATPAATGRVLVPNSSPLGPDSPRHPYPFQRHDQSHDVAPSASSTSMPGQFGLRTSDPLSAPSGFVTKENKNHASLRRPRTVDDLFADDEEPPRKRTHYGSPVDAFDVVNTPTSPEIQRMGQRRRTASESIEIQSNSSDDSLPDASKILQGSSRPRIVRGRADSPSTSSDVSVDPKFIRFRVTMPTESPVRVQAAWTHAAGDVKRATELLSDPSWVPRTSPQSKAQLEIIGRVRELDEATKAQRVAAKEKGKKSMIYANRPVLETQPPRIVTPSPSKPPNNVLDSPTSPIIAPRQKKRTKKIVIDSDSEPEFLESDNEGPPPFRQETASDIRALDYFNTTGVDALQELSGCTREQADTIINLRPFDSIEDLNTKLGQGKKKVGPAGISPRMFEDCKNIFDGYGAVDSILEDCERIGASLREAIAAWTTTPTKGKGKADCTPQADEIEDGALSLRSLAPLKDHKPRDYLTSQPALLSNSVELKEYQLLGVNWLHLLYRRKLSCILADEMGLGKTIQVISFFAYLKQRGNTGPHLVVVPSSTLENWCREFARFAPSISVQTYYAKKEERSMLRQTLLDTQRSTSKSGNGWEVLITTYNLAQGDDRDRKFFKKVEWESCVFDEGHVLKNFQSQRYQSLLKVGSKWRLLLTGTPLQNNLQELVSLMNFILPHHFAGSVESLRAIFKTKGDSTVTLLSQERISRAKKMMTPFVLRRRKDQVLKDLPSKTERIEWCDLTALQKTIYNDTLRRSRKTILDVAENVDKPSSAPSRAPTKKVRAIPRNKDKMYAENSSNVLMDLRKAASHPMLFRTRFTDDTLSGITKQLLKEPDFKKRGALFDLVKEDMTVMTDAELQVYCATYKSTRKYLQDPSCYLEAGKIQTLLNLLSQYVKESRKILIFSQFTQILDILQAVLKHKDIQFLVLTGTTPVDVRQSLVDEFTEDASIPVFLLSTKAGGMGINLTAASVVIMFDQDFNPHNDRQAQDRAYRIGQKRDVEVVKLISRGTIEEDMLKLGETKLALDEAVAGDGDDKAVEEESAPEREMKTSLMNVLRRQFEEQHSSSASSPS